MSFDEQDRQSNRVAPPPSGVIPGLPAGGGWAPFLSAEGTPYQAHEVRQSRGARYRTCLSKLIRSLEGYCRHMVSIRQEVPAASFFVGGRGACLGGFALCGLQRDPRAERSLERVWSTLIAGDSNAIHFRRPAEQRRSTPGRRAPDLSAPSFVRREESVVYRRSRSHPHHWEPDAPGAGASGTFIALGQQHDGRVSPARLVICRSWLGSRDTGHGPPLSAMLWAQSARMAGSKKIRRKERDFS